MNVSDMYISMLSLAISMALIGIAVGWIARGAREDYVKREMPTETDRAAGTGPGHSESCNGWTVESCLGPPLSVPATQRETGNARGAAMAPAVFHSDGYPMPVRKAWGDIGYDELSPMFLDQFLLRYDHALMPDHQEFVLGLCHYPSPWEGFTAYCPWAKERPLLFEQLTGYKLNELQLNNAIAEYVRRLQKQEAKSNG
jgi:hypothetical protein